MFLQSKSPFRPKAEVSQSYNDGVVSIYTVTDDNAGTGYAPKAVTTELITLAYQERKLGIRRYYEAKQNQIDVERVIRVPKPPVDITNQDVALTEDGNAYRIDLIQTVPDVWPPSLDLTLVSYTQDATPEDDENDDDPVSPEEPVDPDKPVDPDQPPTDNGEEGEK